MHLLYSVGLLVTGQSVFNRVLEPINIILMLYKSEIVEQFVTSKYVTFMDQVVMTSHERGSVLRFF